MDYKSKMPNSFVYSRKDAIRVINLFSNQMFFLKASGQMNPKFEKLLPPAWKALGVIASILFCIFTAFLTLHVAIFFAVTSFMFFKYGDLEDITDALTMLTIYSFAAFGNIYWTIRSRKLEDFLEGVNKGYEHHSLPGLTFVSAYPSYEFARKITNYWQFACIFGVIFWALTPLILQQRILPVKCWYPFDVKQEYVYEVIYFVQFLAQCEMGAVFGNGSAVYVSIIIIMLGQFDVLFCSLKNIQTHSELLAGENLIKLGKKQSKISIEDDELNQYIICKEQKVDMGIYIYTPKNKQFSTEELQLTLQYSMKRCILHHQFILRSCARLEALFNPYCLVKSLQITVQLCLLVFIGVVGDRSVLRSMNLFGYLWLTSVELLMFTYCGELLRTHSLRAGEALLRSSWHKNTPLIKREILIFLANTKKPIQLTAGKFFVMNVERLRSVVTQAFSFLTLLQKIAAKKP